MFKVSELVGSRRGKDWLARRSATELQHPHQMRPPLHVLDTALFVLSCKKLRFGGDDLDVFFYDEVFYSYAQITRGGATLLRAKRCVVDSFGQWEFQNVAV